MKITVYWINSAHWGRHEMYFMNDTCIGVFDELQAGIVEKLCLASGGKIEFVEHPCSDDGWRDIILQQSGFGKPQTND